MSIGLRSGWMFEPFKDQRGWGAKDLRKVLGDDKRSIDLPPEMAGRRAAGPDELAKLVGDWLSSRGLL